MSEGRRHKQSGGPTEFNPVGRSFNPGSRVPPTPAERRRSLPPLDVTATLRGKKLIIIGGTGFLGKVLVGMLLQRFPEVGHIYLMVRGKGKMTPKERFEQEVWATPCFDPLRAELPFAKLYQKLTPIPGDVVEKLGGIPPALLDELRRTGIDAVLNVAGVVSFDPPLDEGLRVNAVGVQNLLELCRELAVRPAPNVSAAPMNASDAPMPAPRVSPADAVPLLHTSTCYVAGGRTGTIWEDDPRDIPFPRCETADRDGLARSHWDPLRELEEGMAIARHLRARAVDAQMESRFLERARAKLRELNRPTSGEPLEQAIKKEREKFIDDELGKAGMERAKHWGWPNTYTYTKSIGEQLLAASGQPYTIVRPAIVESSFEFPFRGWNEGINTSAPLIYLAMNGQVQFPTRAGNVLDVIPVDMVCAGTILSAAALLRGEQAKVYQYGTGDTNPLTLFRLIELTSLFKRRFMRSRNRGNPLVNRALAYNGLMPVTPEQYRARSTPAHKAALDVVSSGLKLLKGTPLSSVARGAQKNVDALTKQMKTTDFILETFIPFMAEYNYCFRCDGTREEYARLVDGDRARLLWQPEKVDWRDYWIDVHIKGLRKWVFPHLEAKLMKRPRAEDRFSDLVSFLEEVADREGNSVAVQRLVKGPPGKEHDGQHALGVTYRDLRRRAHACASRLADLGVHPGDRVALIAKNSPEWAIAFFGILATGAAAVPLDPTLSDEELGRRMKQVGATMALLGEGAPSPVEAACLDLIELCDAPPPGDVVEPPEVLIAPDDTALIAYTAGTTGAQKPVVLTHKNVTAVLASVAPLFKISRRDSGLSVLPLFHTFELTCGLLLPMLRGARVTYVDDVTAESLADAFQVAGITAMIGVPQVWEELEEKIQRELQDSGPLSEAAFKAGVFVNRTLGKALGVNLGRVLFRPIHDRLGGKVRFLVSTGGPVPKKTADTFRALGIELKQGYGLTEAAPVLALGDARGQQPIPGVEVQVRDVNEDGVGEIVARGDAVMRGYLDDELTAEALGPDGWLRTGDLGRIDKDGRITVVARDNEVITLASGRRVYPRGIEDALLQTRGLDEVCVVGVPDGQGGERVACLAVAREGEDLAALERAVAWTARKLEEHERPSAVIATRAALPRTSDRKVKRTDVIAAVVAEETRRTTAHGAALAPAEVLGPAEVAPPAAEDRLPAPGRASKSSSWSKSKSKSTAGSKTARPRDDDEPLDVPAPVRDAVKGVLGGMQRLFYEKGLELEVEGQQNIPWNRQTIVVANHASHLDMGLVKIALGSYGQDIVALAAKDYFFEGKWRRTYFERFTNLRPLDRGDNPREAMREASGLLERGHTVLLFPEGTRTSTGEMAAFRPAVTWLALKHGVDILPVYVDGTFRSMPRGSFVPRNRRVGARIGEVIPARVLKEATDAAGLRLSAACQKTATVVHKAVEALRDGRRFDLERALDEALGRAPRNGRAALGNGHGHGDAIEVDAESETARALREIFLDLEKRFQKESVKEPATFYFSLGEGKEAKWTVRVAPDGCLIVNDKLEGKADCVFKTDAKMFTRIIREHYIPDVSEFLNGTVKTNDPELLTTFLQAFNL